MPIQPLYASNGACYVQKAFSFLSIITFLETRLPFNWIQQCNTFVLNSALLECGVTHTPVAWDT